MIEEDPTVAARYGKGGARRILILLKILSGVPFPYLIIILHLWNPLLVHGPSDMM